MYFLLFYIVGVKQMLPGINDSYVKNFYSQMTKDKIDSIGTKRFRN